MRTLTLNLVITVKIPEFDLDGEPLTEADQTLSGVEVSILKNGEDITSIGEVEGCDTTFWDLVPDEENFTLGIERGYY